MEPFLLLVLVQQPGDLAWFGVPVKLRFLEDWNPVARDLEPASSRRNQFDVR